MKLYDEEAIELFTLLKEMEYAGKDPFGSDICPMCGSESGDPHFECQLEKWIKRMLHV